MAREYAVRMKIESIAGGCPKGHQVGEEYLVEGRTPEGICLGSFNSCMPYLTALRFGASFHWEQVEGTITHHRLSGPRESGGVAAAADRALIHSSRLSAQCLDDRRPQRETGENCASPPRMMSRKPIRFRMLWSGRCR